MAFFFFTSDRPCSAAQRPPFSFPSSSYSTPYPQNGQSGLASSLPPSFNPFAPEEEEEEEEETPLLPIQGSRPHRFPPPLVNCCQLSLPLKWSPPSGDATADAFPPSPPRPSLPRRDLVGSASFPFPADTSVVLLPPSCGGGASYESQFRLQTSSPPHLPPFPPIFFRVTRAELKLRDGRAGGRAGGRTLSSSLFSYSVGASRKRGEIRYEQTPQKGGLFLSLLAKGVRGGGKGPVCF